ncbi:hypothetical protein T4B_10980 [Trichinella pseudospiralis]|uniref:Uncharacterized protein n=1 Tax=Trichinella pseudospiralis TaxID=6337 RepID=A0A0V1JFJ6_TRIPS|nr:hypothetical protein T4E_11641 [Trichinella pseudospiralis]KRY74379.1 hypothetical protein T4A_9398 [Trichinella pseudospiralis]KRZ33645.1 hypothetical protein T4B_10980 [Trichinella pseudospiralis]KRZ40424.1 hypothetical protein T4C_816 [Trichinella pseudospiralis]
MLPQLMATAHRSRTPTHRLILLLKLDTTVLDNCGKRKTSC